MKFNQIAWEKTTKQKRAIFYLWPSLISGVILFFVMPAVVETSLALSLLTPWLSLLIFLPFFVVDIRRHKIEAAHKDRVLQARYDAEDKAMFGKPLREIEL